MQFIDKVTLKLKAGNGGDGLVAFRREKYVPLGGPSGGDGGKGGSIIFVGDANKSTLLDLRYTKEIRAKDGGAGKNNKMHGASADDVYVKVPLGTLIRDLETGNVIGDITEHNEEIVVCNGGKGGLGNVHFASSINSAPEYAKLGQSGEAKEVLVELKLLADAGLIGFPSVGKSTILSVVSSARPEIADYPFTTLRPQLGMVKLKNGDSFVLADLPGLIKGASQGKGLGHTFLKHIERCRVLVHVIDMSGEYRDPIDDYKIINEELLEYPGHLDNRPQIVVANKMDIEGAEDQLARFKEHYPDVEVYPIIAFMGDLDKVLYRIDELIKTTPKFALYDKERSDKVVYKYEEKPDFTIHNEGNGDWRIVSERIERMLMHVDMDDEISIIKFGRALKKMNVDSVLESKGCKPGDHVYINDYGFIFKEEDL